MPEPTNDERAQWAAQVARRFSSTPSHCGDLVASLEEIEPDDVADLLADLMHLCRRAGMDFDALFTMANMHYLAEIEEESMPCNAS